MQVTSTLWLDRKSQKISEYRFRLKWTKVAQEPKQNESRQANPNVDQTRRPRQAQPPAVGGGWRPGQAGRPYGRPTRPMGPTTSTSPRVASPLVAEVGCSSLTPWLPAINTRGVEIGTHTHTSHLSSLAFLA